MEVGDQRVDTAKGVAGRDEQVGRTLLGPDLPIRRGAVLQDANDRRADRDHPAAARAAVADLASAVLVELESLVVHDVIFDAIDLDRLKGPWPDVQRDAGSTNPPLLDLVEQARREVQPGGRRRHGARPPRVDGLVALAVLRLSFRGPLDVGRERHRSRTLQHLVERVLRAQAHPPDPLLARQDLRRQPVLEFECRAHRRLARAAQPGAPDGLAFAFDQQQLDASPGRLAPDEPRREDTRVVDDEQIVRREASGQIAEAAMPDGFARQHQQPRLITRRGRILGDRLRGKLVFEILGPHRGTVVVFDRPCRRRARLAQ